MKKFLKIGLVITGAIVVVLIIVLFPYMERDTGAPKRPRGVPPQATWRGAADEGFWLLLAGVDPETRQYRFKIYADYDGHLVLDADFKPSDSGRTDLPPDTGIIRRIKYYEFNKIQLDSGMLERVYSFVGSEQYGQGIPFSEQYDSVIYPKVEINGVPMSGNKKDILDKIGKPQKIMKFVSDATTDHWFEYHYGRTNLHVFDDGRYWGFELRTRAFAWRYGSDTVWVGDPLSLLCKYFPASCRTMKAGKAEMLRVRCQGTDAFIHFHTKNNIITSIETWQDI